MRQNLDEAEKKAFQLKEHTRGEGSMLEDPE
jgi:hypothetical protein